MDLFQISIFLVVAAIFGIVGKWAKQPLLTGYVFAGFVLTALGFIKSQDALASAGQVGVTLLLFLVGLEMGFGEFTQVGRTSIVAAFLQIIITSIFGFFITSFLKIPFTSAVFISIALAFSSTIIVIKLLSEKNDLESLYGRISVGFLLIQDVVAIFILMFLASVKSEHTGAVDYVFTGVRGMALLALVWFLSKKVLPTIFKKFVSGSSELLFITSLAWALGFASLAAGPFGFTFEIGGFLAGLALSNVVDASLIASKTRPLRDFFMTMFFLFLGTKLLIPNVSELLLPTIILSAFVLIFDPIIVFFILILLKHKKRTAFFASVTVTSVSEFSLILIALSASVGLVENEYVSLVILVGVVTMIISSYIIVNADRLYSLISSYLAIFERKGVNDSTDSFAKNNFTEHVVVVGCGRAGRRLVGFLEKRGVKFLVVDFNPLIYQKLVSEKIPVVFGDITDSDVLDAITLPNARFLISTTANFSDSMGILDYTKKRRLSVTIVLTAATREDALKLYEAGANYVILPNVIAADYIVHILDMYGTKSNKLKKMGSGHFSRLTKMK
ncbi:MAG: cation:proton antiporter [Patescibacteria group bacterium]